MASPAEPRRVGVPAVTRLSSGLPVAVIPRPGMRSAALAVGIRAGSRDERDSERGAAHFLEHLLMRGTQTASGSEITRRIDGFGGTLEPFTTRDWTCVAVEAPARHARIAARTLFELVTRPALSGGSVEAERNVILEELRGLSNDPRHVTDDAVHATLFAGHALGGSVTGSLGEVEALDEDALQSFYRRNYRDAGKVAVVGVAAVDERWLVPEAEHWFGDILRRPTRPVAPPTPRPGGVRQRLPCDVGHVAVAVNGVSRDEPRLSAMTVLNELVGGGLSSRWVRMLREDQAIAYDVASVHEAYLDGGMMVLHAGVPPHQVDDAAGAAHDLLDDLGNEGVAGDELERARERAIGRLSLETDINYSCAWRMLEQMLFGGGAESAPPDAGLLLDRIERVTRDEVSRLARKITRGARATAIVDPTPA